MLTYTEQRELDTLEHREASFFHHMTDVEKAHLLTLRHKKGSSDTPEYHRYATPSYHSHSSSDDSSSSSSSFDWSSSSSSSSDSSSSSSSSYDSGGGSSDGGGSSSDF